MSDQHQAGTTDAGDDEGAVAWWSRRDDFAEHRRAHLNRSTRPSQGRTRHCVDDLGGSDLSPDVPTLVHADGLSASQRLLLGMVLFGPVTYRQAADRTGLTPAQVSQLCAAALRQLAVARRPADTALRA